MGEFGNFPRAPPRSRVEPRDPRCTTPTGLHTPGLGFSPFARRYSGNRDFFLFLGVLRCVTSPR